MGQTYQKHTELLTKLGLLVVEWNRLESCAQLMVYALAGADERIDILTAHMGTVSLSDALRTLAAECGPPKAKPHIDHFLALFERIRDYRNYYVHGLRLLVSDKDGRPVAMSQSQSAKARLVIHEGTITDSELQTCIDHIEATLQYAGHIFTLLWGADKVVGAKLGASFLQKPPLPDKLQKPRRFRQDGKPQPRSFPLK